MSAFTGANPGARGRAHAAALESEAIRREKIIELLQVRGQMTLKELIHELTSEFTIVIVTHSMQQAARVSQRTAYFHLGKLVEVGNTADIFSNPTHEMTRNYITGRFG